MHVEVGNRVLDAAGALLDAGRMADRLIPTRSIARRRVSALDWTSGMRSFASRWFIARFPFRAESIFYSPATHAP
jgi:hypothetical protein